MTTGMGEGDSAWKFCKDNIYWRGRTPGHQTAVKDIQLLDFGTKPGYLELLLLRQGWTAQRMVHS